MTKQATVCLVFSLQVDLLSLNKPLKLDLNFCELHQKKCMSTAP